MRSFVRPVTGISTSDRERCPPFTPDNYRLTTSSSGVESFDLAADIGKCGKCMVQLVVRPRRRRTGIVFVIGIGTGGARGCNAAHIVKGIKSGAETLSGIAVDDEGELERYLIDFVWT